jgi:cation transport regulator ChaC
LQVRQRQFRAGKDTAQKVVKIMGDAAGHHSDAFQLLPGEGFHLRAFQIRDVDA